MGQKWDRAHGTENMGTEPMKQSQWRERNFEEVCFDLGTE